MLTIGDPIPAFSVADQDGNTVTHEQLIGQKTVIYFYPKDSTPGCTAEACNLRDNYQRFLAAGYQVYGVSKDSQKSHQNFIAKNQLPFPLLSDPSTEMLQAFGAWGEKKMCGKTSIGTLRKTFVFDEKGILVQIIDSPSSFKDFAGFDVGITALSRNQIESFCIKYVGFLANSPALSFIKLGLLCIRSTSNNNLTVFFCYRQNGVIQEV